MIETYGIVKKDSGPLKLSIGCIICGEPVELNDIESQAILIPHKDIYKVCDKCRDAVMRIRNIPKAEPNDGLPRVEVVPL